MKKLYIMQTEQNILNVIAAKYFNYNHIVVVKDKHFKSPFAENGLLNFLFTEGYQTETLTIDLYDSTGLESLGKRLESEDVFVIPNSRFAFTLNTVLQFKDLCQLAFVEEDGDIYLYKDNQFCEIIKDAVHLNVEDYIENFGGTIQHSNEVLFEEACAKELFNVLMRDLNIYRNMLKQTPIRTDQLSKQVHINFDKLSGKQQILMEQLIDILVKHDICARLGKRHTHILEFYDPRYKEFISKSGSWLEMATYLALTTIKDVESEMSSVFFYWNKNRNLVSNEIDVMGTYDNRLVLISCKDTGNQLEKALYELYTHGEQLGFDTSIKILVTTGELYSNILQRAKELGIYIVQFDKDIRSLNSRLKNIFKTL
ncbi:MAG: DUF1887 family protein [Clostridia bacterium]|nr:DUF1887 family protein [Clostridia bacterium]